MTLFGNNYDTSLKPQQAKLNLSVDPYISQQMPFEHGIAAMPASPYGGGPSEEAQTVGAVGNAVTGVVDAYRQKKKMDAEKAYQDKLLSALGIGGPTATATAPSSPVQAATPQSMGIAEQDPEFARSLQAQSHQRYMNALSAQPSTSAGLAAPSATPATTSTTPTGASTFQLNGAPMQPTTPAPAPSPATSAAPAAAGLGGLLGGASAAGGANGGGGLGGIVSGLTNGGTTVQNYGTTTQGVSTPELIANLTGGAGMYGGTAGAISPSIIAALFGGK